MFIQRRQRDVMYCPHKFIAWRYYSRYTKTKKWTEFHLQQIWITIFSFFFFIRTNFSPIHSQDDFTTLFFSFVFIYFYVYVYRKWSFWLINTIDHIQVYMCVFRYVWMFVELSIVSLKHEIGFESINCSMSFVHQLYVYNNRWKSNQTAKINLSTGLIFFIWSLLVNFFIFEIKNLFCGN